MLHFLLHQTNLWVKLLFRPGVAVLAPFSPLTFTGIPPLLALFHSWTRQSSEAVKSQYTPVFNNNKVIEKDPKMFFVFFSSQCDATPVFVLVWAAPPVLAVVVVRTGITLTAQARRLFTELCFVVGQHVVLVWG